MRSDWESWGDVSLDLESASINTAGDEGWIAVTATVSQTIGREEYASYLTYVRQYIAESPGSAEEKSCATSCAASATRSMSSAAASDLRGCCA